MKTDIKYLTLIDKIGIRKTMNICYISSLFALVCVTMITPTTLGKTFATVRPIFSAISLPLETVMISVFANEMFGSKSFNNVVGLFSAATTAGFALASPFSQLWDMIFGDYTFAMVSFAVLMLFVSVTMQFVLKSAYRDRKAILEALEKTKNEEVTTKDTLLT